MGFTKEHSVEERMAPFDLSNENDRRIIHEFEKELEPYEAKRKIVLGGHGPFERSLSGFDLYLHENGILSYSRQYPLGALIFSRLEDYRFLKLKMEALNRLRDGRLRAREREIEQTESLVRSAPAV